MKTGGHFRDGQSPLHLSCSWGLELIVQALMEHNAEVNAQVGLPLVFRFTDQGDDKLAITQHCCVCVCVCLERERRNTET